MQSKVPLYPYGAKEARERGELDKWRESFRENCACAGGIDILIRENFDGMHLKDGTVEKIVELYGYKRTEYVLANTVQERRGDGRFRPDNRAWAENHYIPEDEMHNYTVTITAAKTFYAQFTANSYTLTWDLGNGTTEETKQTYGEKLALPTEPTRKNAEFLGWFTEANGGTQVDANTIYKTDGDSTYYAHWEITEVFSVTIPVVLPLMVDENGEVHVGTAEIINGSTGEVIVSSVSISTKNGWKLVPFDTDMAHAKVDAKQLGFKINDSVTRKTGDAETFSLTSPWTIAENARLPLDYDAVVSAVSQPVTEQDVLSVVFVLEWKGE